MNAKDLINKLYDSIKNCKKCRLHKTRKNIVFGEGDLHSQLLIVAQAPGQHEDEEGKIFIGPAGKIFDHLLKIANIDRKRIFITNLIKCFLPKYRRPKWDEIFKCKEYLFEEIKILQPKIIVPLGYYSTKTILEYFHFPLPERRNQYNKIFVRLFTREYIKILPLPHPALIFHDKKREKGIINGFKFLGEIYKKYC